MNMFLLPYAKTSSKRIVRELVQQSQFTRTPRVGKSHDKLLMTSVSYSFFFKYQAAYAGTWPDSNDVS